MPLLKIIVCLLILTATTFAQPRTATTRKTFSHPQGFSFEHPADWKIESNDEAAQILPPGLTADDQTENFRLLTIAAPIEVTDPRFAAEMDQLAAQIPGFTKIGTTQSYKTKNGNGLRGVWAGKNLTTNQPVQMRMYATTLSGKAVVLFAAGTLTKLDAREATLREIAASVAPATTAVNRASPATPSANNDRSPLAQQWMQKLRGKKLVQMSSYNSGGGGGGYSSKTEIYINANNTFQARSESSVSVYVPGANGGSGGTKKAAGTWRIYVNGSQALLEMKYENGQIETNALQANGEQTFINGKRWFVTEQ